MKKVWENPIISNLEVKETNESRNSCDKYEPGVSTFSVSSNVNPEDAPYCYCANCDGRVGYDGEMKPVQIPCKYAGVRNPACSA